jgi:hypothetical protein
MLEGAEMAAGARLALEAGIGHERECIRFWSRVLERGADAATGSVTA